MALSSALRKSNQFGEVQKLMERKGSGTSSYR
jgi:hypothetical protein